MYFVKFRAALRGKMASPRELVEPLNR